MYRVDIFVNGKQTFFGQYKLLEDAIKTNDNIRDKIKKDKKDKILNQQIIRNENNIAIINNCILVDDDMYYKLLQFTCTINNTNGYFNTRINNIKQYLHRYIMNYTGKDYIDHINGDKLDNRNCNLRIVTPHQNSMNK